MKVEYEGRTYETEPSPRVVYCRNCGKKLPENWIEEWRSGETPEFRRGRKLYTRTYGYNWESLFCTLRCGYAWACKTYPKHPYNFNGAYK